MADLNLYVAQFVSVAEEQWWSTGFPPMDGENDP